MKNLLSLFLHQANFKKSGITTRMLEGNEKAMQDQKSALWKELIKQYPEMRKLLKNNGGDAKIISGKGSGNKTISPDMHKRLLSDTASLSEIIVKLQSFKEQDVSSTQPNKGGKTKSKGKFVSDKGTKSTVVMPQGDLKNAGKTQKILVGSQQAEKVNHKAVKSSVLLLKVVKSAESKVGSSNKNLVSNQKFNAEEKITDKTQKVRGKLKEVVHTRKIEKKVKTPVTEGEKKTAKQPQITVSEQAPVPDAKIKSAKFTESEPVVTDNKKKVSYSVESKINVEPGVLDKGINAISEMKLTQTEKKPLPVNDKPGVDSEASKDVGIQFHKMVGHRDEAPNQNEKGKSSGASVKRFQPPKNIIQDNKKIRSKESVYDQIVHEHVIKTDKAVSDISAKIRRHIDAGTKLKASSSGKPKIIDKAEISTQRPTAQKQESSAKTANRVVTKATTKVKSGSQSSIKEITVKNDSKNIGNIKQGADKHNQHNDQNASSFSQNVSFQNAEAVKQHLPARIIQVIQKEVTAGKQTQLEQWQHHKFIMDDGKSINVSIRQNGGVLHLQIGSQNAEMNRLLQQQIQDLRMQLQEHFNLEIDLQFQNSGQQNQGTGRGKSEKAVNTGRGSVSSAGVGIKDPVLQMGTGQSARFLGFNRNEWTG